MPDFDRRGLFAVGIALVFALGAIAYAGYLGSQAPVSGGRSQVAAIQSPAASPSPSLSPSPSPTVRSIAFLGDSWTLGAGTTCGARCGFAEIAASQLGMMASEDAVAGTGYANGGGTSIPGPDPFGARVAHFESLKPDIAVIAGGQSDSVFLPAAVQKAATPLIAKLRQDLPHTSIMVIGPFSASGQPSPQLLATRNAIQAAAKANSVAFIDPIAEKWITGSHNQPASGNAPQYIGPDGLNPSIDGYKYLADRLVADLKQLKLG
jgi:lysophospholipase L1-like esterase